jgi:hypothetical protein
MTNLSKWNVTIEHGPTSADAHEITVQATSSKDARIKAEKWAEEHNVVAPSFGIPWQDNYDDFLEWDNDDEEDFISVMTNTYDSDER